MSPLQEAIDAVMAHQWHGPREQLAALERLVTEAQKVAQPAEPVAPPSDCGLTECQGKPMCARCQHQAQPAEPVADDALAALDWNRLRDGATRALDPANQWAFDKLLAQPAEPVAWLHKYRHKQGGRRYQQAEVGDATDPPHRHPEPQEGFEWIGREPLCAAPQVPQPERVPLKDELLRRIARETFTRVQKMPDSQVTGWTWDTEFARAIERAHGIGAARAGGGDGR